ncbi:unnamed protein product [Paramecium sonneborni]|uniref:Uncharacterized protein n=1 Tax=Paramecium sonneborni TaxID=65129 RepID=A0A8S1RRG3_9CILI|nr:unnamed protein product [Paramecium sonneborni]
MKKFFFLLVVARVIYPFIYYDTGLARDFDYTFEASFNCRNGLTKSATIPFSDTFEKIPQVFFTPEHFEQEMPQVGFQIVNNSHNLNIFYSKYILCLIKSACNKNEMVCLR